VEVWAAGDLRCSSSASLDSYCILTVGQVGATWVEKTRNHAAVKTQLALRQRHPRWGAVCTLRLPSRYDEDGGPELTVRVMAASAMRSDKVLGEVRIGITSSPSGAKTFRLLGGGYASLSLRWSTSKEEVDLDALRLESVRDPSPEEGASKNENGPEDNAPAVMVMDLQDSIEDGDSDDEEGGQKWSINKEYDFDECFSTLQVPSRATDCFEEALAFWTTYALPQTAAPGKSSTFTAESIHARARAAQALAERLRDVASTNGSSNQQINELILQAPLAEVLACDVEHAAIAISAIASRLAGLTPQVRSRVAGALVERLERLPPEMPRGAEESLLSEMLFTCRGDDLIELKRHIDTAGTGLDLRHVVFHAITDNSLRENLLEYFIAEAPTQTKPKHVLSDIDMTVYVGNFGTGGGPKFPLGRVPGAVPLYQALGGRITFVSARPPAMESRTRRMLMQEVGIAECTVLQGTLGTVMKVLWNSDQAHKEMGDNKMIAFQQFALLHPEAQFVFIGDSGQGDVDFATAFMEQHLPVDATGRRLLPKERRDRAALIHDVAQSDGVKPKTSISRRSELRMGGVTVFDTYVGAATEIFRLGFIDADGLRSATHGCMAEFNEIKPDDFRTPEVFEARRVELLKDLSEMNNVRRASLNSSIAGLETLGPNV